MTAFRHAVPVFLLALAAAPADAIVSRRSGGAIGTDSFNDTTKLVQDLQLYSGTIFKSGTTVDMYSLNSFSLGVYAVPAADCWNNIQTVVLSEDPYASELRRTDCDYEFNQGDELELTGSLDKFLDGVAWELTWTIGNDIKQWEWLFSGDGDPSSGLNVKMAMPGDLGVGDYWVDLQLRMIAPDGLDFFYYSNILDPEFKYPNCPQVGPNPEDLACGQVGHASDIRDYRSRREDLHVFASSTVPVPGTLGLLLGGGLLLLMTPRRASR